MSDRSLGIFKVSTVFSGAGLADLKPGAVLVMVRLTIDLLSFMLLIVYVLPSSESWSAQSSAKQPVLSSENSKLLRGVEHHRWGLAGSLENILELNWQVVRMPLINQGMG